MFTFQVCIGKECLGDAFKKMKKYKQASKSYQEALSELSKMSKGQQKDKTKSIFERI